MGEIVERRLKDIEGFHVWKITDNKGLKEDNINCFTSLKELKEYANNY